MCCCIGVFAWLATGGFAHLMLPTRPTSVMSTTTATVTATTRTTAITSRSAPLKYMADKVTCELSHGEISPGREGECDLP